MHKLPHDMEVGAFPISERAKNVCTNAQGQADLRGHDLWCEMTNVFRLDEGFRLSQVTALAMKRYGLSAASATHLARIVLITVEDQETPEGERPALRRVGKTFYL